MITENVNGKIISTEDMQIIKSIAIKYNLGVPEFGREITRQSNDNQIRQIRITKDEKDLIISASTKNGVTSMARWCSLACSDFLKNGNYGEFFSDYKADNCKRNERINVPLLNHKDEIELLNISTTYSIKIASLIRFCVLKYSEKLNQ